MPVVPWRGPPPFGGKAQVLFGARRPAKTDDVPMSDAPDGSKYMSLIGRWDSDGVIFEEVPDPPA